MTSINIHDEDDDDLPLAKAKPDEIKVQKAKPKQPQGMPTTVKIILEENDNIPPTGLFLGYNGRGYMIRPGEEVNVPSAIIEILDNAVTSTPVLDGGKRIIGHRSKLRYPYRRVQNAA